MDFFALNISAKFKMEVLWVPYESLVICWLSRNFKRNPRSWDDQGFCLKLRREKQYEENARDFGEKIALLYMNSYAKYCIFEWISNATLSRSAKTFINLCTKLISKGNFRFSSIPISSRIGLSWIYPIMGIVKWNIF